jgi:hypothetical protein
LPKIGRPSSVKLARSWPPETRDHSSEQPFLLYGRKPPSLFAVKADVEIPLTKKGVKDFVEVYKRLFEKAIEAFAWPSQNKIVLR